MWLGGRPMMWLGDRPMMWLGGRRLNDCSFVLQSSDLPLQPVEPIEQGGAHPYHQRYKDDK